MKYTEDDMDYEEQLPPWAVAKNDNQLVSGAHLPTRDGRHTGNAHIVSIGIGRDDEPLYSIMTDAGNTFLMTASEVRTQYYASEWISDPVDVVNRFSQPQHEDGVPV